MCPSSLVGIRNALDGHRLPHGSRLPSLALLERVCEPGHRHPLEADTMGRKRIPLPLNRCTNLPYPLKPSARRPSLHPRNSLHDRPRHPSGSETRPGRSPPYGLWVFLQHKLQTPVSALHPHPHLRFPAHPPSSRTGVAISVVLFLVLLLVWEFLVARIFYQNWRSVRTVKVYGWSGTNLLTRIALFTLYVLLGIV